MSPGFPQPKEQPRKPALVEPDKHLKLVKQEYPGLCASCKNAEDCTFPRNMDRPIIHCDEFEGIDPRPSHISSDKVVSLGVKRDASELRGLCRHCAIRDTCTYPKNEGGVWYCDEYMEET